MQELGCLARCVTHVLGSYRKTRREVAEDAAGDAGAPRLRRAGIFDTKKAGPNPEGLEPAQRSAQIRSERSRLLAGVFARPRWE